MKFITVRHLHDENVLKTYGQNGPLKPNQDETLKKIVTQIENEITKDGKKKVRLLFIKETIRVCDTAKLIAEQFEKKGFEVKFSHDSRLGVMDQGDLNLPPEYKDGEWFIPLEKAWDAICDEAYIYKNIFYKFGDHLDGKYSELKEVFSRCGESMGWSLINKYSFIYDLIHGKFTNDDELLVIVGQSDLPLILMELEALYGRDDITPENLPYKCWEVYKSGLQNKMKDKNSKGDGNFDVPMGYVGVYDLSYFRDNGFDQIIRNAGLYLAKNKQ